MSLFNPYTLHLVHVWVIYLCLWGCREYWWSVFTCRFSLHSPTKGSILKKVHTFLLSSHMIHPPPPQSAEREKKDEELGEVGAVISGGEGLEPIKTTAKSRVPSFHFVPSTIPLLHRSSSYLFISPKRRAYVLKFFLTIWRDFLQVYTTTIKKSGGNYEDWIKSKARTKRLQGRGG